MDTQQRALTIEEKLELIRMRAIQFGLTRHDLEEAIQEVALYLLEFNPDPEKANNAAESTIIIGAIDLRLKQWLRSRKRYQNLVDRCESLTPSYTVISDNELSGMEIGFDVQHIMTTLSEFEQDVCQLLIQGKTVWAIAQELQCDRRLVQQAIDSIREQLLEAGYGEEESDA